MNGHITEIQIKMVKLCATYSITTGLERLPFLRMLFLFATHALVSLLVLLLDVLLVPTSLGHVQAWYHRKWSIATFIALCILVVVLAIILGINQLELTTSLVFLTFLDLFNISDLLRLVGLSTKELKIKS